MENIKNDEVLVSLIEHYVSHHYRNGSHDPFLDKLDTDEEFFGEFSIVATACGGAIKHDHHSEYNEIHRSFDANGRPDRLLSTHIDGATTVVNTISTCVAGGGGIYLLNTVKELILKWISSRECRVVKVKFGNTTIEVKGASDLSRVIEQIKKLKDDDVKK